MRPTTILGCGLLPMAALLCHCESNYRTAPPAIADSGEPDSAPLPPPDGGSDAPAPTEDAGPDAAVSLFAFQPSNISLTAIMAAAAQAQDEDVASPCAIETDTSSPEQDCFNTNGITAVTQSDGSTVNVIVVHSLKVETNGSIRATGSVPLILVSLTDVTLSGSIDAHSEDLSLGAGGSPGATDSSAAGLGKGGGVAGNDAANVGGGGGSYCVYGGMGGGQTTMGVVYGNEQQRPLIGGSSGGSGDISGYGAGGGAVQIVAAGTITMNSGSYITVGGEGGEYSGAGNQVAGGGGSGGAIVLEATAVAMSGLLAANGGGGGGSDATAAGSGADATPDSNPAPGGTASSGGAAGGNGAAGTMFEGSNGGVGSASMNPGGGGGGVGWIGIHTVSGSATVTGTTSPTYGSVCAATTKARALGTGP